VHMEAHKDDSGDESDGGGSDRGSSDADSYNSSRSEDDRSLGAFLAWRQETRGVGERLRANFPNLPLCSGEACVRNGDQCQMAVCQAPPGEAPLPCPLCWRHRSYPLETWSCCCDCSGFDAHHRLPSYLELTATPTVGRQQQAAAEARPDEPKETTAASSMQQQNDQQGSGFANPDSESFMRA